MWVVLGHSAMTEKAQVVAPGGKRTPVFLEAAKEFLLCTDASDVGLGGILMQERNGNAHPIVYASRLCTAAKKKEL